MISTASFRKGYNRCKLNNFHSHYTTQNQIYMTLKQNDHLHFFLHLLFFIIYFFAFT